MRQDVRGLTAKHHRNSDTKLSMQRGTHASTMGQPSAKPAPAPNLGAKLVRQTCTCFGFESFFPHVLLIHPNWLLVPSRINYEFQIPISHSFQV
jgi:hypothetical protein